MTAHKRASDRSTRDKMRSPGRPEAAHQVEQVVQRLPTIRPERRSRWSFKLPFDEAWTGLITHGTQDTLPIRLPPADRAAVR